MLRLHSSRKKSKPNSRRHAGGGELRKSSMVDDGLLGESREFWLWVGLGVGLLLVVRWLATNH